MAPAQRSATETTSVAVSFVAFKNQITIAGARQRSLGAVRVHTDGARDGPANAVDAIDLLPSCGLVQVWCDRWHTEIPITGVLQLELVLPVDAPAVAVVAGPRAAAG